MFEIIVILMFVALLAALLIQWRRSRSGAPAGGQAGDPRFSNRVPGTLTLTGVSDKPVEGDKNHQVFCTMSGTIAGPDTAPTDVYGRFVVPMSMMWPSIGDEIPVTYKPGKAETSWQLAGPIGNEPGPAGPNLSKD